MTNEYFECDCYSDEHLLKFSLDEEDGSIYTSTFLNQYHGFWVRLWVAIKYLFGYKCKYGHFDCVQIRNEDRERLVRLLEKSMAITTDEPPTPKLTNTSPIRWYWNTGFNDGYVSGEFRFSMHYLLTNKDSWRAFDRKCNLEHLGTYDDCVKWCETQIEETL